MSSATFAFMSGVTASRCGLVRREYQRLTSFQSANVLTRSRWATVVNSGICGSGKSCGMSVPVQVQITVSPSVRSAEVTVPLISERSTLQRSGRSLGQTYSYTTRRMGLGASKRQMSANASCMRGRDSQLRV